MAREAGDSFKVQELLQELVRVCKKSSEAAALFHDNLFTESGELMPALQRAAAGPPPPKVGAGSADCLLPSLSSQLGTASCSLISY